MVLRRLKAKTQNISQFQFGLCLCYLHFSQVTHVINCAKDLHKFFPKYRQFEDEFEYWNLQMEDTGQQEVLEILPKTFEYIEKAISAGGTVFVHCAQGKFRKLSEFAELKLSRRNSLLREFFPSIEAAFPGVSRSGCIVVGYLMAKQKITYEEALKLARAGRICCRPNWNFMQQLKKYETVLQAKSN